MSNPKYYMQQGTLDGVPTQVGDYKIQFDQAVFIGATWFGTFETSDSKTIEALDKVVGSKGISEITQEEYMELEKKRGRHNSGVVISEPVLDQAPTPQPENPNADSAQAESNHSIDDLLDTKPRDDTSPINFTSSKGSLAKTLGISQAKLNDLMAKDGNPGKSENGYNIPQWESFLNRNS